MSPCTITVFLAVMCNTEVLRCSNGVSRYCVNIYIYFINMYMCNKYITISTVQCQLQRSAYNGLGGSHEKEYFIT